MHICGNRKVKDVLQIEGKIAFVSQTAWIQNATLRDNILFYKPYDKDLYSKTLNLCELETDLQILDGGDQTEIGEKGINLSGGQKMRISLARAVYSQSDIYLFDDPLAALDGHVGKNIFYRMIKGELKDKTRMIVTNNSQFLPEVDRIIMINQGKIIFSGSYNELSKSDILSGFHFSTEESSTSHKPIGMSAELMNSFVFESKDETKIINEESKVEGQVSLDVYIKYFKYAGGVYQVIVVIIGLIVWDICRKGGDFWMRFWMTEPVLSNPSHNFIVYAAIMLGINIFVYLRLKLLVVGNINVNNNLHTSMITSLINAPINLYHDSEPKGRILNRLSKDLENLNEVKNFVGSAIISSVAFLGFAFFIAYNNVWILIWIPFMILIGIKSSSMYIHPSRELKRLEGLTRSKILNVISEVTPGISIIFSDGQTESYRNYLNELLTNLTKIKVFIGGFDSWNGLVADLNGIVFVSIVLIFIAALPDLFNQVIAGQTVMYCTCIKEELFWTIYSMGSLEKLMVSMERCLQYTDLVSEKQICQLATQPIQGNTVVELDKISYFSDGSDCPSPTTEENNDEIIVVQDSWPLTGKIRFQNYYVGYRPNTQVVLKNINLSISGGEKIGVVGRTGSGKSTLSLCLFRLLEAWKGKIEIDGMDISKVPLNRLRESLTIIPQDSAVMEGSLRYNIDPLMKYKDEEILSVLQSIGLWDILKVKNINSEITEDNLSVGEKQLVCIARAILRRSKIVIIDEATASIDLATEEKIQNAFNTYLASSTVIAIAHRIKTISSYDKVLVLDKGKVKEFDRPSELLKNTNGIYYDLHMKSLKQTKVE